ncbi:MAG: hypothetical protein ACPGQS_05105 [Bradymonadia bacterium]
MNRPETLLPILRHLYEGRNLEHPECMDESLVFRDPVVIVEGRAKVQMMFKRLNTLFPHTEIIDLTPSASIRNHFELTVAYRTTTTARTRPFNTQLHCHFVANRLKELTEHWYVPMKLSGGQNAILGRAIRRVAGRVLSLG